MRARLCAQSLERMEAYAGFAAKQHDPSTRATVLPLPSRNLPSDPPLTREQVAIIQVCTGAHPEKQRRLGGHASTGLERAALPGLSAPAGHFWEALSRFHSIPAAAAYIPICAHTIGTPMHAPRWAYLGMLSSALAGMSA